MLLINLLKEPKSAMEKWVGIGWNAGLGGGGYFKPGVIKEEGMLKTFLIVSLHLIVLPILLTLAVVYVAQWMPKQWLEIIIALWVAMKLIKG